MADERAAFLWNVDPAILEVVKTAVESGNLLVLSDGERYVILEYRGKVVAEEICPLCDNPSHSLANEIMSGPQKGTKLDPPRCLNCLSEIERMEAMFGSGKA